MKQINFKKVCLTLFTLLSVLTGKSQVTTLLYEDWTSNSFTTNGWTFPFGQSNWNTGYSYTPFNFASAPNAYFNWSPSVTNYSYSLLSPTINATAVGGQNVTLTYLLQQNSYSQSTLEQFKVEYKDVASSTWTLLNAYDNTTITFVTNPENYSVVALPLPGVAGQNFQLRFTAFGVNSFNLNGWGLDSILVNAEPCPTVSPVLSITASSNTLCEGTSALLTASGANSYTWMPGNITGGAITVSPTSNTTYTLTGVINGCTVSTIPAVGTISVLTTPTVATSGISSVCQGASGTISATGAPNFSWMPSAGLSSTTGSLVTSNPGVATTYTVVGIGSNGCTDTTYHSVSITEAPSVLASASPTAVCGGGNSQLTAFAATTSSYAVTQVPFDTIPTPASGVTILADGGTEYVFLDNGSLDDGDWENISLPFTFNFFGGSYNSVVINTNGFVFLGPVANTQWGYGSSFPDPFSAAPSIGGIYSDLNFSNVGRVEYFTVGAAPNRTFVVNYRDGDYFFSSGNVNVQIKMFESSNIVEVHTAEATGDNTAVEGIQDGTGSTAFTVPNRNGQNYTVSTATPDGYRFAPAGGTPTYSWSPSTFLSSTSVSNPTAVAITASTVYSVTATESGCSTTQTVAINAGPSVPTITASLNPGINCDGTGTVNVTTAGSVSTYSWSNGATTSSIAVSPTVTTTYTVIGTNTTGCTVTETVTVPVGPSPLIVAVASTNTICAGNPASLNVAGASTYTWSNGATTAMTSVSPSVTTTYTVIGTAANGCKDTTTLIINVNTNPIVTMSAASNTACINGPTLGLTGTPNTGTFVGTNVQQGSFTPGAVTGTFYPMYTVTNAFGCTTTASVTIVVSACTGILENSKGFDNLFVYPNPNNGVFTVELNNNLTKTIDVMDLTGRVVIKAESTDSKTEVNINSLSNGVYFVRIKSGSSTETIKVVKQ